jgi:hypothetical protein
MKKYALNSPKFMFSLLLITLAFLPRLSAQQAPTTATVPRLVNFSGKAADAQGNPYSGTVGVTFAIYPEQSGSAPLWIETQSVEADRRGVFVAQLGSTKPEGLPVDLFTSGEARWLGVRINGGEEQPRVMLLSVPYALKAGDAATLGGMPLSAFVLAAPTGGAGAGANPAASDSRSDAPPTSSNVTTTGGTANMLPLFTTATNVQSSAITQLGTGAKAQIGINTTTPTTTLDVHGGAAVRGTLVIPATGLATAAAGKPSEPINMTVSTFNTASSTAVGQTFQLKTEPANNNTANPGATFNLLFGHGANPPAETGFRIGQNGIVSFAAGQTFPGAGTITGVAAGTGLTGGGSGGSITLNLDTTKVPQLNAANTFTGNQTVNGNHTATGVVTGSSYQIGSDLFGFGNKGNLSSFIGFAGSAASTGANNTGVGPFAIGSSTTGTDNTAVGANALFFTSTGSGNTAVGSQALTYNTGNNYLGNGNTAVGNHALTNSTSSYLTAIGDYAMAENTTGAYAVAVGESALSFNTTGNGNTGVGFEAIPNNSTGSHNTAVGMYTLLQLTGADENSAVGAYALEDNYGHDNTAVGYLALSSNTDGNDLTCIGANCNSASNNLSNATAIGAHSLVSVSDSVVLGSVAGINGATATAKVGIGTSSPTAILTIGRGTGHPVSDSWETYSSRRWKTNIHTLPNALAKVEQLRGVTYDQKDSGKHEIGVIAEEVGAVVPEIVTYEPNGRDARGVDYARLTALLIEAAKQQQRLLRTQQADIHQLKAQLRDTQQSLRKMQAQLDAGQSHTVLAGK